MYSKKYIVLLYYTDVSLSAQKMGLVACPTERLTEEQWTHVKARSVQQGESARPCAICKEEFHFKPQVLPQLLMSKDLSYFPHLFRVLCLSLGGGGSCVSIHTGAHTCTKTLLPL